MNGVTPIKAHVWNVHTQVVVFKKLPLKENLVVFVHN